MDTNQQIFNIKRCKPRGANKHTINLLFPPNIYLLLPNPQVRLYSQVKAIIWLIVQYRKTKISRFDFVVVAFHYIVQFAVYGLLGHKSLLAYFAMSSNSNSTSNNSNSSTLQILALAMKRHDLRCCRVRIAYTCIYLCERKKNKR